MPLQRAIHTLKSATRWLSMRGGGRRETLTDLLHLFYIILFPAKRTRDTIVGVSYAKNMQFIIILNFA
ncbi:hypothetical protein QFZ87_003659 [Bacillus sp. SLBN-46]|nr:hypothetical protein [Bacillus sp. SLBN-46]